MLRLFLSFQLSAFVLLFLTGCGGDEADDSSRHMAEQHANDTPEATALVMEPRMPVNAQAIQYGTLDDSELVGYMAEPQRPDSVAAAMHGSPGDTLLPAIILIHEWWGLNDNVRAAAQRLAGEGFRVLAVDFYKGDAAETPEAAQQLMRQSLTDTNRLRENARAAYQYLKDDFKAPRVAVMGWCYGGGQALQTAVDLPSELDAAVIYYGQVSDVGEDELESLDMPIIGFFGAEDGSIPVDGVRAFEQELNDLGKDAQVYVYEGAGHAFANPSGTNFVQEAATDAWDKTITFLRQHLYGTTTTVDMPDGTAASSGT